MRFSNLKRASDREVKQWLIDELDLSPYQKNKLYMDETIRFSPFYFYKVNKVKVSPIWRLTLLVWPIYWCGLVIVSCIKWLFTGEFGFGRKFIDNFHSKWAKKINI